MTQRPFDSARLETALTDFLAGAAPCLLLVAPQVATLEAAANTLTAAHPWPRLALGRELSTTLWPVPPDGRARFVERWLAQRIAALSPGPALCTEIDLLFEPSLNLDPLALLRRAARTTRLIVTWPGAYNDSMLSYAAPEHAHYRVWKQPEVSAVSLG